MIRLNMPRILDVYDGLSYSDGEVPRCGSISIRNESGCYALVRVGGMDVPADRFSASKVVPPYTHSIIPAVSGYIAIHFTTQPGGAGLVPSVPGGLCTIDWFLEGQPPSDIPLSQSFVTEIQSSAQDDYPYTIVGQGQSGAVTLNFPGIDFVSYQGARFFIGLLPAGIPPSPRQLTLTLITNAGLAVASFPLVFTMGSAQAAIIQFPVPYSLTPGAVVVTPQASGSATDQWRVLPVRLVGSVPYKTSFSG